MNYTIYFDGACEPVNPNGHMGLGICVVGEENDILHMNSICIKRGERGFDQTSNNLAEYLAILEAMKWIRQNLTNGDTVTIYGDSKLVINQMNLKWGVNGGVYAEYANIAFREQVNILHDIGVMITCEWIGRDQNGLADELSKEALVSNGIKITEHPKK